MTFPFQGLFSHLHSPSTAREERKHSIVKVVPDTQFGFVLIHLKEVDIGICSLQFN